MESRKVEFENERGLVLSGILDGGGERGAVLCNHFTGFKEFRHLKHLAEELAGNGFTVLRFDYSDCIGESEGSCEDMGVTHQLNDTVAAIDFLEDEGVGSIGLVGHSLGGTTAVLTAANDRRVEAVVPIAALAKIEWDKVFRDKAEKWEEEGYITFDSWKEGEVKIDYSFYEDLKRYDASQLVKSVDGAVCVIQAGDDELVPRKNGEAIYDNAPEPKQLEIVKGADHMFSDDEKEREMIEIAVGWLDNHL